jgi:hypothetical protein
LLCEGFFRPLRGLGLVSAVPTVEEGGLLSVVPDGTGGIEGNQEGGKSRTTTRTRTITQGGVVLRWTRRTAGWKPAARAMCYGGRLRTGRLLIALVDDV